MVPRTKPVTSGSPPWKRDESWRLLRVRRVVGKPRAQKAFFKSGLHGENADERCVEGDRYDVGGTDHDRRAEEQQTGINRVAN